ncbi:hypothetical protein FZI27_20295 [Cronobacter sakazakii]|nr:hypothetical protein FZI27_20295 [Cronobacter sakazakii]
MIRFEYSETADLYSVLQNGKVVGLLLPYGYEYLVYEGPSLENCRRISTEYTLERAKLAIALTLARKAREDRQSRGFKERAREFVADGVPGCSCGAHAVLKGRYSVEKGLLTWRYDITCASRCGVTIRLYGDIFVQSDAINAWRRKIAA